MAKSSSLSVVGGAVVVVGNGDKAHTQRGKHDFQQIVSFRLVLPSFPPDSNVLCFREKVFFVP